MASLLCRTLASFEKRSSSRALLVPARIQEKNAASAGGALAVGGRGDRAENACSCSINDTMSFVKVPMGPNKAMRRGTRAGGVSSERGTALSDGADAFTKGRHYGPQ